MLCGGGAKATNAVEFVRGCGWGRLVALVSTQGVHPPHYPHRLINIAVAVVDGSNKNLHSATEARLARLSGALSLSAHG